MFGHKQKPEKVREGHKAAGSAWMTLSFPPPTCHTCHSCHLAQLRSTQHKASNARNSKLERADCCQMLSVCNDMFLWNMFEYIQAVLASTSRKWVCQVILPHIGTEHPGTRPTFAYFRTKRLPPLCKWFLEITTTSQLRIG